MSSERYLGELRALPGYPFRQAVDPPATQWSPPCTASRSPSSADAYHSCPPTVPRPEGTVTFQASPDRIGSVGQVGDRKDRGDFLFRPTAAGSEQCFRTRHTGSAEPLPRPITVPPRRDLPRWADPARQYGGYDGAVADRRPPPVALRVRPWGRCGSCHSPWRVASARREWPSSAAPPRPAPAPLRLRAACRTGGWCRDRRRCR